MKTNLPSHWQIKKLGDVCEKISLNKIKIKQKDYMESGKYPVIDQGQTLIGGYFNDENLLVPGEPPYIIFGDHTKIKKYVNFKFIAGADGVKVLKPHPFLHPKYFFYVIHTVKIPDKGYARHFQFLEKELIPIPPLPEQEQIVAKIEELFSEIDAGVENIKTAQEQLKVYRQSLLKWAFEGKLTNTEIHNEQLETHSILITKGASPRWQGFEYINDQSQMLFITSENVRENSLDLSNQKFLSLGFNKIQKRSMLKKGDVLFNLVGASIGRAAIYNLDRIANINQAVALIRLKNSLNINYLTYFLNSEIAKQKYLSKIVNVARANISLTDTANIEVPYCSLTEQLKIVEELESRLTVRDKLDEDIRFSLERAESLRQSILKQAFEGKLVNFKGETDK